ncbi:MAG TPA: ComEC/Rec2 family competence protein [Tenuifilaceae bacterium]|nr:ComEC/Rec2 family competence protein [Tenuifilaceae bacterium]HPE19447.1 ComEC/Rec2 family competence protein [Tenuifilaceae bacterium]
MSQGKSSYQVPFFRLLIPFVLGIITALVSPVNKIPPDILSISTVVLLATSLLVLVIPLKWRYRWVVGINIYLFLLTTGIVITYNFTQESRIIAGIEKKAIVRLIDLPEKRTSSIRGQAIVMSIFENETWVPVNEKTILYFKNDDSLVQNLDYGSILAVNVIFDEPPEAQNPCQFNYKEYLKTKQIHRVAFVKSENWIHVEKRTNPIFSVSFYLRNKLVKLFEESGIYGQNLAVLSALTMGYKNLLDDETRRIFSASGAMHILAVSGLHVGVLFFIVSSILFFLDRTKKGKKIKAIILILFLWFFAIFTGLSPSVLRASLMFSLVILGTAVNRKTNIYNTLSASAFVLLCFNPMLIKEIGFQLSYLAVTSIVFFYPHIYKLIYVRNKWLDKVWSLIAVSIAAQAGTFPLGLYYFHQFPNYFLLTNLFAIPLASIILYLVVLFLFFSFIPATTKIIGFLIDQTLSLLNYLVGFTESLPYSITSELSINNYQVILLLGSIVTLILFFEKRRFAFLAMFLGCLLLHFSIQSFKKINQLNEQEVVVFNIPGVTTIGFTHEGNVTFAVTDTTLSNPLEVYSFQIRGYVNSKGLNVNSKTHHLTATISTTKNTEHTADKENWGFYTSVNSAGSVIDFMGKIIFIPDGEMLSNAIASKKLEVDLMIITSNFGKSSDKLFNLVSPKLVVIDSSVPPWELEKMLQILDEKGIEHHSVQQKGAFTLKRIDFFSKC